MDIEDIQAEIEDTSIAIGDALEDLANAASCETLEDLELNLKAAISSLDVAKKELEMLVRLTRKARGKAK